MPQHHTLSANITADKAKQALEQSVTRWLLESKTFMVGMRTNDPYRGAPAQIDGIRIDAYYDQMGRHMVAELSAKVASKLYEVKAARYPATWVDCLKVRFAKPESIIGRWILKRWPVQWEEIRLEASAYYPGIAIPGHQAFVEVMASTRRSVMEEEMNSPYPHHYKHGGFAREYPS